MNNLIWKLNTNDPNTAAWVAEGIGGVKFNILLGKEGIEGIVILPSGHVFIAAFEETETTPVDEMKAYLNSLQVCLCNIRDLSIKWVFDETKKAATKDQKRIILP